MVSGCCPRKRSVSSCSRSRSATSFWVASPITRPSPSLTCASGVLRALETGQELLELPADLLAGRQGLVLREQAAALGLGAGEGVVLLLERGDDLLHLVVGGEVATDLLLALLGQLAELVEVDRQPGGELDLLQQRLRGA